MPDGVRIDRASHEDVDGITRIEEESFPQPWRPTFFESELDSEGRFNLVARLGSSPEPVGYLFAMWLIDELHINKIAVSERFRRNGIANAMMDEALRFARKQDIRTVWLEVRRSNHGAQEFYRCLGFEARYLRAHYYPDGEAAVVMVLDLEPASD